MSALLPLRSSHCCALQSHQPRPALGLGLIGVPASPALRCLRPRPALQEQQQARSRRGKGVRDSLVVVAQAASASASPEAEADSSDGEEELCSILMCRVDNAIDPKFTKLTINVQQYPGLLRTVAWTLNGLGVRVQNATMHTDEDNYATSTYWLSDLKGSKLSDFCASNVQESLQDFIETCMPRRGKVQDEWDTGDVFVSNRKHDKYTELLIMGEPTKPGFLLEIATVMSACGANVHEAVIQGSSEFAPLCPQVMKHDFAERGRIFRFLLTEGGGAKLAPGRVAAILYTLDLVAGKGYQPTSLREVQHARSTM